MGPGFDSPLAHFNKMRIIKRTKRNPGLIYNYNHKTGEYNCKDEKGRYVINGKCTRNTKGKQGRGSFMGTGGSYGSSDTNIICDDNRDIEKILEKKYKKHKTKFKI